MPTAKHHTPLPHSSVPPASDVEAPPAPAVSYDRDYLEFIVRRVSGDREIEVRIGERGKGSFYNPLEPAITLDPQTLEESPNVACAVSAHEARHRKETPTPEDLCSLGFDPKRFEELGFPSLSNVIEDMAINCSAVREFPRLAGDFNELYRECREMTGVGVISHPEAQAWIARHGFTPRFAVALGELLKDWAIQRAERGYEEKLYLTNPEPKFSEELGDEDVLSFLNSTLRRARLVTEILPAPDEVSHFSIVKKGVERFTAIYDALFPDLQVLIKRDIEDLAALESAKDKLPGGEPSGERSGEPGGGAEPGAGDKMPAELQEALSEALKDLMKGEPGGASLEDKKLGQRVPFDKLSQELKAALKEWFENLPKEIKEAAIARAIKNLKDLEDGIAVQLNPKLSREPIPLHRDPIVPRVDPAAIIRERYAPPSAELLRMQAELRASRSEYERVRDQMMPTIATLEERLRRILLPNQVLRAVRRQDSGNLNTLDAMQSKFDISLRPSVFEKRTRPTEHSASWVLLADVSGSMQSGGRALATQQASVILGEVWERLRSPWAALKFTDTVSQVKLWGDSLNEPDVQARIAEIGHPGGENDDARAVREGRLALQDERSDYRFIFIISDTESAGDDPAAMKREITAAREAGIIVIHFGLGKGTQDRSGLYPKSYGDLLVNKGGAITGKDSDRDFLTVLCSTLERAVITPWEFLC